MFYRFMYYIAKIVVFFWWNVSCTGKENIPEEGPAVIVANHQANIDPVAVALQTKRKVHFLGKKELFKGKIGSWFFRHLLVIPVDRKKVSPTTLKDCLRVLKEGELLGIFPEGTRVKAQGDAKPMSGFVMFALRAKCPVIPVHIDGEGMGFRSKVHLTIGKPIDLSEYSSKKLKSEKLEEISLEIMDNIYKLK